MARQSSREGRVAQSAVTMRRTRSRSTKLLELSPPFTNRSLSIKLTCLASKESISNRIFASRKSILITFLLENKTLSFPPSFCSELKKEILDFISNRRDEIGIRASLHILSLSLHMQLWDVISSLDRSCFAPSFTCLEASTGQ